MNDVASTIRSISIYVCTFSISFGLRSMTFPPLLRDHRRVVQNLFESSSARIHLFSLT